MTEPCYDFELDRVVSEIKKADAKKVGLELPEGLKTRAVEIAEEIEKKTGAKTYIFIDPVYGACDTKEKDAELLGLDLVIHFGHTSLPPRIN